MREEETKKHQFQCRWTRYRLYKNMYENITKETGKSEYRWQNVLEKQLNERTMLKAIIKNNKEDRKVKGKHDN